MGMFDYITVNYPLPDNLTGEQFQTKDLECYLQEYEIAADGTLWHTDYDVEDKSDPNAKGLMRFVGCATRTNKRRVQMENYTGEVRFYNTFGDDDWKEFVSLFKHGKLIHLEQVTEPI